MCVRQLEERKNYTKDNETCEMMISHVKYNVSCICGLEQKRK